MPDSPKTQVSVMTSQGIWVEHLQNKFPSLKRVVCGDILLNSIKYQLYNG